MQFEHSRKDKIKIETLFWNEGELELTIFLVDNLLTKNQFNFSLCY